MSSESRASVLNRAVAVSVLLLVVTALVAGCGRAIKKSFVENRKFFVSDVSKSGGTEQPSREAIPILVPRHYKVGFEDLLLVRIHSVIDVDETSEYRIRVSQAGEVTLPLVGKISVSGKTLEEVERTIDDAYSPDYVREPQSSARVLEFASITVSVLGEVKSAGLHKLARHERTLLGALTKAGGPTEQAASVVRIQRANSAKTTSRTKSELSAAKGKPGNNGLPTTELIRLPLKGSDEKFVDVPLEEGDIVVVGELPSPTFLVTGLVVKPGAYTIPTGYDELTLLQAISCAGGIRERVRPEFVTITRSMPDGKHVSARFKFNKKDDSSLSKAIVLPGDVVCVNETAATRTAAFFDNMLMNMFNVGFGGGAYFNAVP